MGESKDKVNLATHSQVCTIFKPYKGILIFDLICASFTTVSI